VTCDQRADAASIEELIALFAKGRCAVMKGNPLYIHRGPPPIRLDNGKIIGPERDGNPWTDERFANELIRDFAHAQKIDLLAPPGTHYRWTSRHDEPDRARNGTLHPSRNRRVRRQERGLSVVEGPWFYCLRRHLCWFVKGHELKVRGSDGEPLLEVNSLEVVADIMTRRQVLTSLHMRNRDKLSELSHATGVPSVDLFALLIGLH
jgi:hypothetical protein